jgi:hypothetical protein
MKTLFFLAILLTGFVATASPVPPPDVNDKILKAFNRTFAEAKDVSWYEYENYSQANFVVDRIQVRAQYAQDGSLIRTIRYYGERELLPNVTAKLKKRYSGKEIVGVTELSSDAEVSFTINLKDEDNWYIVKSDVYGNLEQTDKFKRADKE